jgi:hypothetical protein
LNNWAIAEINADFKGNQYRKAGIEYRQHPGATEFFGESKARSETVPGGAACA